MITPDDLKKASYEFVKENGLFIWYKQTQKKAVVFLEQQRSEQPKGPQIGQFTMMVGEQPNRSLFEFVVELNDKSKLSEVESRMNNFDKACAKI